MEKNKAEANDRIVVLLFIELIYTKEFKDDSKIGMSKIELPKIYDSDLFNKLIEDFEFDYLNSDLSDSVKNLCFSVVDWYKTRLPEKLKYLIEWYTKMLPPDYGVLFTKILKDPNFIQI